MEIKPFRAYHLRQLLAEPAHEYMRPMLSDPSHGATLEQADASFTAIENGRVVGCGGIMPVWAGRAIAWSVLSANSGPCMVPIHIVTRRLLRMRSERRIEATCDADFKAGHRWLRLLGFELEAARMEGFAPDGRPHSLYARIQ